MAHYVFISVVPSKSGVNGLSMVIGILRLTLHLPNSGSLKAKRQVVSGLLKRVRQQFQVAAAEVGERDRWQRAEVAVACLSTENGHADEILAHVLTYVERSAGEAEVADVSTELIRM
jgi:uncharacterized protein YlxP (DUF503 family)